jgi:hypothetical protein
MLLSLRAGRAICALFAFVVVGVGVELGVPVEERSVPKP